MEFKILWLLVRAQGIPLTQSEIEEFIYRDIPDDKDRPLGNSVGATISKIRAKLFDIGASFTIPREQRQDEGDITIMFLKRLRLRE